MNSHNESQKRKPSDLDKKTIIQNFDLTSIQAPEEVNDLLENHSLEEENSLTFDDLDFSASSLDDAQDLLPLIEDSSEIDLDTLDTEELESELDIDLSVSLDSILDSDFASEENLDDLDELDDVVADSIDLDLSETSDELGELDDILEEPLTEPDELDNLLDSEPDPDSFLDSTSEQSLSQTVQVQTPPVNINPPRQPDASKAKVFDQTMRVSVKKLDNLNNILRE